MYRQAAVAVLIHLLPDLSVLLMGHPRNIAENNFILLLETSPSPSLTSCFIISKSST